MEDHSVTPYDNRVLVRTADNPYYKYGSAYAFESNPLHSAKNSTTKEFTS